ncbi:MAG: GIY-YIG nuclease family protein [Imperialibacter sp.]
MKRVDIQIISKTLTISLIFNYLNPMEKGGAVYIMTNAHHTVFDTGVTSDLIDRVHKHKTKFYPKSFTSRYNIVKLVYVESFHSIEEAIAREKEVKKFRREKKIALIEAMNPEWRDLFDTLE